MAELEGAAWPKTDAVDAKADPAAGAMSAPSLTKALVAAPTLAARAPPAVSTGDSLASTDGVVRRVDEDRWLASRFAQARVRQSLETLYAFSYEVARTAEVVSDPGLGRIRLAWWRDAVTGGPSGAQGLPAAIKALMEETPLEAGRVVAMIEARAHDLEAEPFEGWGDLEAYVDATAGAVAHLALQICLAGQAWPLQATNCARAVGRAWGFTGLTRASSVWAARRRIFLPQRLLAHLNLKPEALFAGGGAHVIQQARLAMLDRARFAFQQARDLARVMPVAAFPAIGYVALEPLYRAQLLAGQEKAPISLLRRQIKLLAASALGRF